MGMFSLQAQLYLQLKLQLKLCNEAALELVARLMVNGREDIGFPDARIFGSKQPKNPTLDIASEPHTKLPPFLRSLARQTRPNHHFFLTDRHLLRRVASDAELDVIRVEFGQYLGQLWLTKEVVLVVAKQLRTLQVRVVLHSVEQYQHLRAHAVCAQNVVQALQQLHTGGGTEKIGRASCRTRG